MAEAVLLRNVVKTFGSFTAVSGIDLAIRSGEFFTLLGPSGCGKTTTLRLIAGFEQPTSGDVMIQGRAMAGEPAHRRPVNTVFQSYALFPHLDVEANVAFGLSLKRVPRAERRQRVGDALKLVRMEAMAGRKPSELSGGQQQRVALARALVNKPSVLLLDEPLAALDLKLRKEMQMELKHMQRQLGITFVLVTHDQEEALTLSDRIAIMSGGKVLQVDDPVGIYERPTTRFGADFIGETNFLSASVVGRLGPAISVAVAGTVVDVPAPAGFSGVGVTLTIRPEALRVASGPAQDASDLLHLPGRLREIIYIGTDRRVVVEIDGGETMVARVQNTDLSAALPSEPGSPIWLACRLTALRALAD
ncbi:ABC transporter ATP-binding protein [Segnochrobactrum spirostomi]|nr:ABC transporter ATP-binding protein [Segnochrobactrum spirostomi]